MIYRPDYRTKPGLCEAPSLWEGNVIAMPGWGFYSNNVVSGRLRNWGGDITNDYAGTPLYKEFNKNGSPTNSIGKYGPQFTFASGTSDYYEADYIARLSGIPKYTMVSIQRRRTSGSKMTGYAYYRTATFQSYITAWSDGNVYSLVRVGGTSYVAWSDGGDTGWHCYVTVFDGTGTTDDDKMKVYDNGKRVAINHFNTPHPSVTHDNVGLKYRIGSNDASIFCDGDVAFNGAWDRKLTQTEAMQLTRNPFAMWTPAKILPGMKVPTLTGWGALLSDKRNRLVA